MLTEQKTKAEERYNQEVDRLKQFKDGIIKHRSQVETRLREELEEKKREGEELFLRSLDDEKQKGKAQGRLDEALQELRLLCGVVQELETRNEELENRLASMS